MAWLVFGVEDEPFVLGFSENSKEWKSYGSHVLFVKVVVRWMFKVRNLFIMYGSVCSRAVLQQPESVCGPSLR